MMTVVMSVTANNQENGNDGDADVPHGDWCDCGDTCCLVIVVTVVIVVTHPLL